MIIDTPRVVRVVAVIDTREWIEDGDRWVAIPGSGLARSCDRCQRLHEIHATVELDDGWVAVVGTGCMRGESMEVTRAMRSAERDAKKARREAFEAQAKLALAERYRAALAEVDALPVPSDVTVEIRHYKDGPVMVFHMEDADVWWQRATICEADRQERLRCLVGVWKEKRLAERGITRKHRMAARSTAGL